MPNRKRLARTCMTLITYPLRSVCDLKSRYIFAKSKIRFSGGGSALLPLPIDILSLDEKCEIIKLLQSKGANIKELNTVRQAMSQLKNGGLARKAKAQTVTK